MVQGEINSWRKEKEQWKMLLSFDCLDLSRSTGKKELKKWKGWKNGVGFRFFGNSELRLGHMITINSNGKKVIYEASCR